MVAAGLTCSIFDAGWFLRPVGNSMILEGNEKKLGRLVFQTIELGGTPILSTRVKYLCIFRITKWGCQFWY